jgi:hypothetical protein
MRQAGSPIKGLGLTACLLAILLATAGAAAAQEDDPTKLPAPVVVANDDLSAALASGELSEAEYALERARSIFQLGRIRREFGDVARPADHDATLILRDLAFRVRELTGADRKVAKSILARPTDGDVPLWTHAYSTTTEFTCGSTSCFHWVETTVDAPALTDTSPSNGIPDWVDTVQDTWEFAWAQEIDILEYRAPLDDSSSNQTDGPTGPDRGKLDVYILDLGQDAVFGYCASLTEDLTTPVYCVVDDDYAPRQYGASQTPPEFLQVTSAHEFHHASQAAYDFGEDYWLLEGTATNMEETVYPAVDDNVNFLRLWSPLTRPSSPLDRGGLGNSEYGSWIFWRFLEEKVAGDPSILREIWKRADAAFPGLSPDDYSLLAVRNELASRGLVFADVFANFGVANRLRAYNDAAMARYPKPPLARTYTVGRRQRDSGWRSWRINHLGTRFLAFRPGRQVGGGAKLRIAVKLPKHGARASLIVVEADGSTVTRRLQRNAQGYARGRTRFGRGVVRRVELVLSNGSTRIPISSCWNFPGPPAYSCLGRPRDDRRLFELRGRLA